ncbi:SAM-dependent methyltransferase [Streptomyces shenzhenensis]|uniref:SAM-dependent methyltransferase n=1 Tax=Streptomyces shenzhenensis TaxID=943815 RepID=UPI00381FFE93
MDHTGTAASIGTADAAPTAPDWYAWHAQYDDLASPATRRLGAVQDLVRAALDRALAARPTATVISVAAGQSRDLLPVLIEHPRRDDIRARVVELDPRNADFAEGACHGAGLRAVEVVSADAGLVDIFAETAPADLILLGELLPLLGPDDVEGTIAALPQLCASDATVVCSASTVPEAVRHAWLVSFERAGFTPGEEPAVPAGRVFAHRYTGPPIPLIPGTRMFRLG